MERLKPTSSCHLTKYQQSGTKINMFLISVKVIELNFFFFLFRTGADICDGKRYISDTVICKYVFTILNTSEDTSLLTVKILLFV